MAPRLTRPPAAAAVIVASATMLAACASGDTGSGGGGDASFDGTITWARAQASNGWDGDKCVDTSIPLNPAVYDTLLRIEVPDGDGLAPGLAASYEWDDESMSYIFELRQDATFSNGDPVTADDVVFSVTDWLNGEFSSSYYASVDHAEAIDEHTVALRMKNVDTFIPSLLTWCTSPIYPADFAGMDRAAFFEAPIGAGPYAVESWEDPMGTAEKITLVPNEHYYGWDGEPPVEKFVVQTVADANQRALMYQSGEVDMLDAVDSATALQLPAEEVYQTTPNQLQALMLNTDVPGLDNADIRKAISLGIDRETVAVTLDNGAIAAVGATPVNVPLEVEPTTPYTYDPDEAKALVDGSGVTDRSFSILYDAADRNQEVLVETLQSQLADIGITLTPETSDNNTIVARQQEQDYEISLQEPSAISPTIWDPISWTAIMYAWSGDDAQPIMDEFLAGTATLDPAESQKHVLAVQDYIVERNAMIGVLNLSSNYAAKSFITGFEPLQYRTFYFDTIEG